MRLILISALCLSLTACSTETAKDSSTESTTTETSATPVADKPAIANTVDPVCGMPIAAADATAYTDHEGKKLGFCSEGCADEFKKDPAQYAAKIK